MTCRLFSELSWLLSVPASDLPTRFLQGHFLMSGQPGCSYGVSARLECSLLPQTSCSSQQLWLSRAWLPVAPGARVLLATHMLATRPAVQETPSQVPLQWQGLLQEPSALLPGSSAFLISSSAARSARAGGRRWSAACRCHGCCCTSNRQGPRMEQWGCAAVAIPFHKHDGWASPAALALQAGGGRLGGGAGFAALALRQLHLPFLYAEASLEGGRLAALFSEVHFKLENLQQLLLLEAGASRCRCMLSPDSPASKTRSDCGSCLLLVDSSTALLLPLNTREDTARAFGKKDQLPCSRGLRCSLRFYQGVVCRLRGMQAAQAVQAVEQASTCRRHRAPAACAPPDSVTTVSILV